MTFEMNKVCRICLEEGVLTSLFSCDFGIMPCQMLMICAKIKIEAGDGLPSHICNNCICRLGVAYHFKQQTESSDIRLRQYLGLEYKFSCAKDAATNTQELLVPKTEPPEEEKKVIVVKKKKKKVTRRRKPEDQKLKRGPKPKPKQTQECFECGKVFKCAAQLEMHIRIHTGERPYECSECPRRFTQKHNLSIHQRTHSGEKPFQCEICSKRFAALGNFQCHKKIHAGIRDQVCPACNKGFISSGDLSRHMVIHTGIKNYHCDLCGKGFIRKKDMIMHKSKVHHISKDEINPSPNIESNSVVKSSVVSSHPVIATPAARRAVHPFHTTQESLQTHPSLIGTHLSLNFLNYSVVNDKKVINSF